MGEATDPEKIVKGSPRWFEVSILLFGLLVGTEWQGFMDGKRDADLSSRITAVNTELAAGITALNAALALRDESLKESFRRRDLKANNKIDDLAKEFRAYSVDSTKSFADILQRVARMEGND